MRVVCTQHPVDSETKQRFSFNDRTTVKDYMSKLSDVCFCYALGQYYTQLRKCLRKKYGKSHLKKKFERPDSMIDLPESNSDSVDTEEQQAKGLT